MKPWISGLISALASGILIGLGAMGISPDHFNLSNAHFENVLSISILGGIVGLLNYLRRSPLP